MLTLAMETILGAATGYVTNDIALKQLFREGGIVEKEREAFTRMLIDMLQEEILQEEVLAHIAEDPTVVGFFDDLAQGLFHRILPDLIDQEEAALSQGLSLGIGLLRDVLASWDMKDLTIDKEKVLANLDAFFHQDLPPAMAQTSLADWGLQAPLEKAWSQLTQWEEGQGLPQETQALLKALLKPLLASLAAALRQKGGRGRLMAKLCQVSPEDSPLETYLEGSSLLLYRHRETLAETIQTYEDDIRHILENLLYSGLQSLVESLDPYREALIGHLSASLDRSTERIPGPLRKAVRHVAERKLDPQDPFLDQLIEEVTSIRFARTLAQKIWSRLEKEVAQTQEKLAQGMDPSQILGHYWCEVSPTTQARLSHAWASFLDKPILTSAQGESFQAKGLEGGLGAISYALIDKEGAKALAQRIPGWAHQPMATWLGQEPALLLGHLYQTNLRPRLEGVLANPIGKESLLGVLGPMLDALETQPLHASYAGLLASLARVSQEGISLEKELADLARRQAFDLLPAFLGRLTKEQLDALSQDEIRNLVLDLLGREMKPLSYLGALVGGIAGAATGVAFSLSGSSPDPASGAEAAGLFASRSLLYGSVGYGTNVLAVRGLFRPYQPVLGWQGLLPKNKDRLAVNLMAMAETYILNDAIWQAFGQGAKDRWQGHRESLADRFLTQDRFCALADHSRRLWPHVTGDRVLRMLGRQWQKPTLKKAWGAWGQETLAQAVDRFLDADVGDRLQAWLQEPKLQAKLGKALSSSFLRGQVKAAWTDWAQQPPLMEAASAYAVGQALGRQAYEKAPAFLALRQESLTQALADALFEELSSLQQVAFAWGDGEKYVRRVVNHFIDEELDLFLDHHLDGLVQGFGESWARHSQRLAPQDLGLHLVPDLAFALYDQAQPLAVGAPIWTQVGQRLAGALGRLQGNLLSRHDALATDWLQSLRKATGLSPADLDPCRQALDARLSQAPVIQGLRDQPIFHWLTPESQERLQEGLAALCRIPQDKLDDAGRQVFLIVGDIVYPAVIDFILEDGAAWVGLLDLPHIISDRVDALDPQELESLVRKIANPYFRHVERMGWLGAVVAIPATAFAVMLS